MSIINQHVYVRRKQSGISILELLLYVIFAAGLVLAAWFGLNLYLDRGKQSSAESNAYAAYKVAKTACMNRGITSTGTWDTCAADAPTSEGIIQDAVDNEMNGVDIEVAPTGLLTIEATVKDYTATATSERFNINAPTFITNSNPGGGQPNPTPAAVATDIPDISLHSYQVYGSDGLIIHLNAPQFLWAPQPTGGEECRFEYSLNNGTSWAMTTGRGPGNSYTFTNLMGIDQVRADVRYRCRAAMNYGNPINPQPLVWSDWYSTPVIRPIDLLP